MKLKGKHQRGRDVNSRLRKKDDVQKERRMCEEIEAEELWEYRGMWRGLVDRGVP
jgi:hypothetical protein